ncbi:unnamed protein product [Schistosoma margrebowiei]|uniref:Uncharacterized protein n=1 Tax=Schistosoma margrebowiei TaxID=48269 RepID=A0A183MC16_9TREM|nr:unnamed protein product [Schistosoma margrebowiei]
MQLDDFDFADGLALLSHTHQRMQIKTNNVTAASVCISRHQHTQKKKQNPQMQHRKHQHNHTWWRKSGRSGKFHVNGRGGCVADIKARIGKARAAFPQLKNMWKSKQLSTNIKMRIFNIDVKTALLYGAET